MLGDGFGDLLFASVDRLIELPQEGNQMDHGQAAGGQQGRIGGQPQGPAGGPAPLL